METNPVDMAIESSISESIVNDNNYSIEYSEDHSYRYNFNINILIFILLYNIFQYELNKKEKERQTTIKYI